MIHFRKERGRRRYLQWIMIVLTLAVVSVHYGMLRGDRRKPATTDTPLPTHSTLTKRGDCYYEVLSKPGDMCVENGVITLYSSAEDKVKDVALCTGFPQTRPEGTFAKIHYKKAAKNEVQNERKEHRVTLFVVPTLETNLFHIIRDTVANVEDMVVKAGLFREDNSGFVFVLPKNPRFSEHSTLYHLFFAGFTGASADTWQQSVVQTASVTDRVCLYNKVFLGQPFKGYEPKKPLRLLEFKKRILQSLHMTPSFPLGLEKSRYILRFINRAKKGINRSVGNKANITAAAEGMGFDVREIVFQELSVVQQLAAAAGTDLMVGAHGQALTWCMFMPTDSVCLELGIWRDTRRDYPLLSSWSGVHHLFVALPLPSQVSFPSNPTMSDSEKNSLNYYKPYSNYKFRQAMVIYPELALVTKRLEEAVELLRGRDARGK